MSKLVYRRLRAPSEDGTALIEPPLEDIPAVIGRNQTQAAGWSRSAGAVDLVTLRLAARTQLLGAAMDFTSQYRNVDFVPAVNSTTPFILTGHQPELFHPGVWFKNFLASSLAERVGGVAINLIVDNDAIHEPAVRVPVVAEKTAYAETVPYDESGERIPYEERRIINREVFSSFGARVSEIIASNSGLVKPLWQAANVVLRRTNEPNVLGLTLAETRHRLEGDLGLTTLELPLHAICRSASFCRFTLELLQALPSLHEVYNSSLTEYRTVNHIRSRAHPVPDLEIDGDWLEAPFWIWTTAAPHRRRAFVRQRFDAMEVTDRAQVKLRLPYISESVDQISRIELCKAEARGIKLRPRALITTMYARLVLSDLFIHGIGGAKYDELTDAIIRRFFGIEPPAYVTATATFRLPIERPAVTADEVREVAQAIRDVRYRPESLLRDARVTTDAALQETLAAHAAEKRDYLARHDLRHCAKEVFERLDVINRAMHELLRPLERELRTEQVELVAQLKQTQLLGSREFSFVLFPSEILPARLLDLCKVSP